MSFDTEISLKAELRDDSGKGASRRLRRTGFVPVTVYGGEAKASTAAVVHREIAAVLRHHGRNKILTLDLDGTSTPVKIADMQLDPVKGRLLHMDLMRISMTEKTEFEVPVEIVGEAVGVKIGGGILDQPQHSLKIRCLPGDLPAQIEVDVTSLGLGDPFRVSDLKIDREKIEVLAAPELVIATVVAPQKEEEPAIAEESAEPEVIKKGKSEE